MEIKEKNKREKLIKQIRVGLEKELEKMNIKRVNEITNEVEIDDSLRIKLPKEYAEEIFASCFPPQSIIQDLPAVRVQLRLALLWGGRAAARRIALRRCRKVPCPCSPAAIASHGRSASCKTGPALRRFDAVAVLLHHLLLLLYGRPDLRGGFLLPQGFQLRR